MPSALSMLGERATGGSFSRARAGSFICSLGRWKRLANSETVISVPYLSFRLMSLSEYDDCNFQSSCVMPRAKLRILEPVLVVREENEAEMAWARCQSRSSLWPE